MKKNSNDKNKGFSILKVEVPNQTGDVQLKMEIVL
jgi:hypothetical protein